jgi:ankyrin repeat protein
MFRWQKQQCSDDTYSVKSSFSRNSIRSFLSRSSRNSRKSRNNRSIQQLFDGANKPNESSFLELAEMGKFDDIYLILSGSNRDGLLPWLSGSGNSSSSTYPSRDNTKLDTPLHTIMIYRPTVAVVDILIKRLNELSVNRSSFRGICRPEDAVDTDGRTPLHIATAEGCDLTVIRRLMKKAGKAVRTRDLLLRYPLHWACANPQGVALSRPRRRGKLMSSDSVSSKRSLFSVKSSSRKCRERDAANMLEVIAALVLVFPRAVLWHDKFGKTPLDIARERNASEMIILLLERVVELGVDTFVTTAESVATRKVTNHNQQPTFSSQIQPMNWLSAGHSVMDDTDSTIEIDFTSSTLETSTMSAPFVFEDSCSSHSSDVLSVSDRTGSKSDLLKSYNDYYSAGELTIERRNLPRASSTSKLQLTKIQKRHLPHTINSSEVLSQSNEMRHLPRIYNSSQVISKAKDNRHISRSNSNSQVLSLSKNVRHITNTDNSTHVILSTPGLKSILKRNSPNGSGSIGSLHRDRQRNGTRFASLDRLCASDTESVSSKFSHSSRSGFQIHHNTLSQTGSDGSSKTRSGNSEHRSVSVLDDETERLLEKAERRLHLPKSNSLINNHNRHVGIKSENFVEDNDTRSTYSGSRLNDTTLATRKRLDDFIGSIPIESHGPFIAPRIKLSQELDFPSHSENRFEKPSRMPSDKTVFSVQSDSRLFVSDKLNRNSRRTGHKVVTFQNQSTDSPRTVRSSFSLSLPRPEIDSEHGQEKIDDADPWEDLRELRVFSVNPKSTDMQRALAIKSINAAHSQKARMH